MLFNIDKTLKNFQNQRLQIHLKNGGLNIRTCDILCKYRCTIKITHILPLNPCSLI